ncbi:hypothetical protein C8R42DRAFT_743411 [Lentinula raphanica]|nr:hypothetical protein C8R42DRAFT_743411 [Lentinula raphanica]
MSLDPKIREKRRMVTATPNMRFYQTHWNFGVYSCSHEPLSPRRPGSSYPLFLLPPTTNSTSKPNHATLRTFLQTTLLLLSSSTSRRCTTANFEPYNNSYIACYDWTTLFIHNSNTVVPILLFLTKTQTKTAAHKIPSRRMGYSKRVSRSRVPPGRYFNVIGRERRGRMFGERPRRIELNKFLAKRSWWKWEGRPVNISSTSMILVNARLRNALALFPVSKKVEIWRRRRLRVGTRLTTSSGTGDTMEFDRLHFLGGTYSGTRSYRWPILIEKEDDGRVQLYHEFGPELIPAFLNP